jgi:hypothetical protein
MMKHPEALAFVIIVGGDAALLIGPPYIKERRQKRIQLCQKNLTLIDGAKEQWALENNKSPGSAPAWSDIIKPAPGGYLKSMPIEPSGGTYSLNPIGMDPQCSTLHEGHDLSSIPMRDDCWD